MSSLCADHVAWLMRQSWHGPEGLRPYPKYVTNALCTVPAVLRYTPGLQRVLHAGGHIGMMSLLLATRFAEVWTFEAAAENYECLALNVVDQRRIHATYGALGDGEPVTVVRHKYSACHHVEAAVEGTVPSYRLDDLPLDGLDALVLDLEGGELCALQHGRALLQRWHPLLVVEEVAKTLPRYSRQAGDIAALVTPLGYQEMARTALDVVYTWEGNTHG